MREERLIQETEAVAANLSWRTIPSQHRSAPTDVGGYDFLNPPWSEAATVPFRWNRLGRGISIRRMAMTRHCWKCGTEYRLPGAPGRGEACPRCNSDLKVCLNCIHYDPRVAEQCRERRADLVGEKHLANYCEYFDFIRRAYVPPAENASREARARDTLKKLLGD